MIENKNKVTIEELESYYHIASYDDLVTLVYNLIDKGYISPIKNSNLNGKKPPLYNRYRIIREQTNFNNFKEELLYKLSPMLKNDYYLKNIEKYINDRKYVLQLNDFFKLHLDSLENLVSYNERSFEIWGREKFLQREGGIRILKNVGLTLDDLNVYDTTEPLAYYSRHKLIPQKVLLIENKDTFYSMRRHLIGGNTTILGQDIGTLIYGGGKSIYKSFQDFTLCVEPYLNHEKNEILYFGDLDYEGILIYEKLQDCFQQKIVLKPFLPAYEAMLKKSELFLLPLMKNGQNNNIGNNFLSYFCKETQVKIISILEENQYIPQEILQIKDF